MFLSGQMISHPGFKNRFVSKPDHIEKIDCVVWFHTDFLRDTQRTRITKIDRLASHTYSEYSKFFKELGCRLVLIGGNWDLYPTYIDYFSPDFVITSWKSLILDIPSQDIDADDFEAPLKFIDRQIYLQTLAAKNHPAFPDKSHPGGLAHARLVDLLCSVENLASP
jgi:hypothetical protein